MLEAQVIGPSTGVIDDKSIVIELILYHVGSEFFRQQRGNFALGHHDNAYRDAKTTSTQTWKRASSRLGIRQEQATCTS